MKKLAIILGLMVVVCSKGQDASFSQYYSSELYLNPALASEELDLTFSSNYRTQWSSIVDAYQTSQMSLIYPFYSKDIEEKHLGGGGLSVFTDNAGNGALKSFGMNLSFGYNLQLSHDKLHNLSFGAQAGFMQKSLDVSNLEWGSQYDPLNGYDETLSQDGGSYSDRRMYPDISAGVLYYYNMYNTFELPIRANLGAAVYHLNKPDQSFYSDQVSVLNRIYKIHGMIEYSKNKFKVAPGALFLYQQDVYMAEFGVSAAYRIIEYPYLYLDKMDLRLGVWMRARDAAIVSLAVENAGYSLGVSYDYNYSSLSELTGGRGAFEISLLVRWLKKHDFKKVYNPRS